MKPHAVCLVVSLLMVGCNVDEDIDEAKIRNQPPPVRIKDDDLMARAMLKARETQQQFADALLKMEATTDRFAIKKGFPTTDGEAEYIWLSKVIWDGHAYTASVDNMPVYTQAVQVRQRVTVQPEEIADWMYFENGDVRGGYTLRVAYHQASPEEQAAMKKSLATEIPAIDF